MVDHVVNEVGVQLVDGVIFLQLLLGLRREWGIEHEIDEFLGYLGGSDLAADVADVEVGGVEELEDVLLDVFVFHHFIYRPFVHLYLGIDDGFEGCSHPFGHLVENRQREVDFLACCEERHVVETLELELLDGYFADFLDGRVEADCGMAIDQLAGEDVGGLH